MKKVKEWLKELPEDISKQALENMLKGNQDLEVSSLDEAICAAFVWSESEQGHTYWSKINYNLVFNRPLVES